MKIGFIGLGNMGSQVAKNLLAGGHELTVWNRSSGAVDALVEAGARAAAEPAETLGGDVLISMLASDQAIRELGLSGPLLERASQGLVHANMATISVDFARSLAAEHSRRGLGYVAMPVFGRPNAAAAAKLAVIVAGAPEHIEKLEPLFGLIGDRKVVAGRAPEQANLFKIAGNFMIASAMETMGEAFALLRKGGVDHTQFFSLMTGSLFTGVVFPNYGKQILEESYEPAGFKLSLGLKDVNLARAAAAELDLPMPLADVMRAHFEEAVELGWGDKDWSALGSLIAKRAGL